MTIGELLAIVALFVAGGALWVGRQARIVYEELERRRLADATTECRKNEDSDKKNRIC